MKNIQTLLLGAALTVAAVLPANAEPYHHYYPRPLPPPPPVYAPAPPVYRGPHRSLEYRAQLRLRQLGYYHGPVDGQIGAYSRRAIARFQHDRRLRATGWLDRYTIRALGI